MFPNWEAIKTTRGHYRSCGKDPHACCVSHLLTDHAIIHSGREATYAPGKDTGRYWDAGAVNVHWIIATEEQVELGIKDALDRVKAPGVFIEGNSFSEYVDVDAMFMLACNDVRRIKKSAKIALEKSTYLVIGDDSPGAELKCDHNEFISWLDSLDAFRVRSIPRITSSEAMPQLVAEIQRLRARSTA